MFSKEDWKQSVKILIVDDTAINLKIATKLLEKDGYTQLIKAESGEEALHQYSNHPDIDLILMDVQMPGMNGYQTTKAIRENESKTGRRTPIIALSANAYKEDVDAALNSGMDDYVKKPIEYSLLKVAIEKHMTPKPVIENRLGNSDSAAETAITVFDSTNLKEIFEDNPITYKEILNDFLHEKHIERIQNQTDNGIEEGLLALVHIIKGSSGTIGALEIEELMKQVESKLRNGEKELAFQQLKVELSKVVSRLVIAIEAELNEAN